MSLADMNWERASFHQVVLAWLVAERHRYVAQALSVRLPTLSGSVRIPTLLASELSNLLEHPNLDDPEQNRTRLRILYEARSYFVLEIPPDTKWYRVHSLKHEHLGQLRAVNHSVWTNEADGNELFKVATRKPVLLCAPPSEWVPPILWGHDRAAELTILEGNHRLTAYAGSGNTDLDIPVYVGISAMRCFLHLPDRATPLIPRGFLRRGSAN